LMRLAWSSVAALAIAPLQDLLNLGPEAGMNVPGRAEGNWTWRCTEEMMSAPPFDSLRGLTRTSNRQQSVPIFSGGDKMKATPLLHNLQPKKVNE
jgi:4-alpha-glucanotransferase